MKHVHRSIADHSPNQQRMFFALINELGLELEVMKEKAKVKFKHGCFNDLKSSEINYCIDVLVKEKEKREAIKKTALTYQTKFGLILIVDNKIQRGYKRKDGNRIYVSLGDFAEIEKKPENKILKSIYDLDNIYEQI